MKLRLMRANEWLLQRLRNVNLHIREDIAKYLLNLDVNSADYDPKTRSIQTYCSYVQLQFLSSYRFGQHVSRILASLYLHKC
ncbi:hypothetical protein ACOSQ2_025242 [Xanthoceras sorbifolium]